MVPLAKKNLHECKYHLDKMSQSTSVEELEINLAAFVNSSRNVTFVLQKEFSRNEQFKSWYKLKQEQMRNDPLCMFFLELRNKIIKEGINDLQASLLIQSFNSSTDIIDRPDNAGMVINSKGIYWHVYKGTGQEDYVPAVTKGIITTKVGINNPPLKHFDQDISKLNVLEISYLYLNYLKSLVEEFTETLNRV